MGEDPVGDGDQAEIGVMPSRGRLYNEKQIITDCAKVVWLVRDAAAVGHPFRNPLYPLMLPDPVAWDGAPYIIFLQHKVNLSNQKNPR